MKLGLADEANLTEELLAAVREPFATRSRAARSPAAGVGLGLEGFAEIARMLPA